MKSFLKYLLATIAGIIISTVIIFFIFLGIISAIVSQQNKAIEIKPNTILLLKLDKPIVERKQPFSLSSLTGDGISEKQIGLNDLLNDISKAKTDTNIRGIYLELSNLQAGIGTIEEIRNALINFKKSGKFIVAYSDSYSQGSYYLSSVANKLYLNPEGYISFVGLSAEVMFFKKTLEKLDIQPEIIRHGKFKSAVEPFMYEKMSNENREQIKTYVGSIWQNILEEISKSRNIPVEKLNSLANNLTLANSQSAVENRIIDTVLYKDQVLDTLAHLVSVKKSKDLKFITYNKYIRVPKTHINKGLEKNKIAVIYAWGTVKSGDDGEGTISSERISKAIREARQDSSIKAIVFRVNSGGGSALASEVIWRELYLAHKVKPVIASMGDVAASGGYYILAAADSIVAEPSTITGSIGVFGLMVDASGFFKNKLGITSDVEKTNTYSDFGSVFRPLSPAETNMLQTMIDGTYKTFVNHVSDGRKLPYENVDKIAEGRVWSGANALDLKLVDVMGGLSTAIDIAAEKAKLKNYRIVELPKLEEEPFEQLINAFSEETKQQIIKRELGDHYKYFMFLKEIFAADRIQARLPYDISVQ